MAHDSRFIVGIDLGTTNIAVSYIDTEATAVIKTFKLKQLSHLGEVTEQKLLPSFTFLPNVSLFPQSSFDLPWSTTPGIVSGVLARDVGCEYPNAFISSAKSWLCHGGVDRREAILPWGSQHPGKLSPLAVTAGYLKHVAAAWDLGFSSQVDQEGNPCVLADQQVVVTIPASFDEVARELTLEATKSAQMNHVHLLEEPLAVFYAWLNRPETKPLAEKDKVLILDCGGGTTDFSMIVTNTQGNLVRSVAGTHLLLGGDNIDLALAAVVMKDWERTLNHSEQTVLVQKVRKAKEVILSTDQKTATVSMILQGSSIIGNSLSYELSRKVVTKLLFEGFLPEIKSSHVPAKATNVLQSMGLPYAKEAAITVHIKDFLTYAAQMNEVEEALMRPTHILFNGGTMIPAVIRKRILATVSSWFFGESPVLELKNSDLTTAVAVGAGWFGYAKRGRGVKVKSGTSRSFYLKVGDSGQPNQWVCLMPRGVDENCTQLCTRTFNLQANQNVSFPLYSNATRVDDQVGDLLKSADELTPVAELVTTINLGKNQSQTITARVESEINEVGVLQVSLHAEQTDHRWPLKFDIRTQQSGAEVTITIEEDLLQKATAFISESFSQGTKRTSLFKDLENILELKRKDWPVAVLRRLSDELLLVEYKKLSSKNLESLWLNLAGFCLRPGFGDPGDELRLKKVWRLWLQGFNNDSDQKVISEWWIFWRRVLGGLRAGQQETIFAFLRKKLCPKGNYRDHIKEGNQSKAEMWRAFSSLELVSIELKIFMAQVLINRGENLTDYEYWSLSRIATRKLFHAPINKVIPVEHMVDWLNQLLELKSKSTMKNFAIARLGAKSGDQTLDIDVALCRKVVHFLEENEVAPHLIDSVKAVQNETIQEQGKILGDNLPLGLQLS